MTFAQGQHFSGFVAHSCRSQWVTEVSRVEGPVIPVLGGLHVSHQDLPHLFPPAGGVPFIFENIASSFLFFFLFV